MIKGTIFDIQKFSVHDGKGIRSTLFIKGCPLRCIWCHNPEGIKKEVQLWYFKNKCIGCHKCIAVCPQHALSAGEVAIEIDRGSCLSCGQCVTACPTEALCFNGREATVDEVVNELLEDRVFYEKSGGGITLSGGEPTFQPDFALAVLEAMKTAAVPTAIESCMYCKPFIFERFFPLVDQFIVDLKLFDSKQHKRLTGVGNELIKDNFVKLAAQNKSVLVRIPLIPGLTANEKNIQDIAQFVYRTNKSIPIELMNYNPLANDKYRIMKQPFLVDKDTRPFNPQELAGFNQIIENTGLRAIKKTAIDS